MYSVTVSREFVARHYLTVPDPGPEGEVHGHRYTAEVTLFGDALDGHGYLVDIDELEAALAAALERYEGETLNDLPEFEGDNPSVERFARELCEDVIERLPDGTAERAAVTMWEDDAARATYERPA